MEEEKYDIDIHMHIPTRGWHDAGSSAGETPDNHNFNLVLAPLCSLILTPKITPTRIQGIQANLRLLLLASFTYKCGAQVVHIESRDH
jgi:hypothetical protein